MWNNREIPVAESKNYILSNEFETVRLNNKTTGEKIVVGHIYGEINTAAISSDELFCAMGGCGLIVYFIRPPFLEYQYNKKVEQWKECWRFPPDDIWIDNIICLDEKHIQIETESGDIFKLNVYELTS